MKPLVALTLALVFVTGIGVAQAQNNPPPPSGNAGSMSGMPMQHPADMQPPANAPSMQGNNAPMGGMMQHRMDMHPPMGMQQHQGMGGMQHGMGQHSGMPHQAGQAAFGAIQEIVAMLQADPATDWSKVDIDALRQHLIDMNELTLNAVADKQPVEHGLRIAVTGSGRTIAAIQRMVPAHAQAIDGINGWSVQAKPIADGEELTVTGKTAVDEQKIRGLGFMGIMVLGEHQMHHMAMAKGEMMQMK